MEVRKYNPREFTLTIACNAFSSSVTLCDCLNFFKIVVVVGGGAGFFPSMVSDGASAAAPLPPPAGIKYLG